jgi:hypothetical protein
MPKIEIEVKQVGSNTTWKEEYVINDSDPIEWAKNTIDKFNSTLNPHESPRELVGVEVLDELEKNNQHNWSKTNLITIVRGSSVYDTMKCEKCGISGKRYGLDGWVIRDSKYKAKKYDKCNN